MNDVLYDIVRRLDRVSGLTLANAASERIGEVRFFSYGSNMNEADFESEMERHGYKLGLRKVEPRVLLKWRRALDNQSTSHGLAFSIHRHKLHHVKGICHSVPIEALGAFASKEGLFSWRPKYRLIRIDVEQEPQPVLSLQGLSRSTWKDLNEEKKRAVLKYVRTTLSGAKKWNADIPYFEKLEKDISRKLSK